MLARLDDIQEYLRCPRHGDRLRPRDASFVSERGLVYKTIGSQPLLIDQESSVIDSEQLLRQAGASLIERKESKPAAWIKRHLFHGVADNRSESNAEKFIEELRRTCDKPMVLIIGGGRRGIGTKAFYERDDIRVVSFDVYASPFTQLVADAHSIPFADGFFDGVWIQYVLEHVLEPWTVVGEIERVLKPAGVVYAESPFLQQVHEASYDFFRFTASGHRWLFRNFAEVSAGTAMGSGTQAMWTLEHLVRGLTRSRAAGKLAKLCLFWIRYIERLIPAKFQHDSASAFFFLGRKTERPLRPKEIVAYYRGAG